MAAGYELDRDRWAWWTKLERVPQRFCLGDEQMLVKSLQMGGIGC